MKLPINVSKDELKRTFVKCVWDFYKQTIENVFDRDGEKFFEFVESINLREELPKVAVQEYLDLLNQHPELKEVIKYKEDK